HERRLARAEPLAVFFRGMPHGQALIVRLVIRPSADGGAKVFELHAQVLPIPRGERGAVAFALEEDAADSGNLRHPCLPTDELRSAPFVPGDPVDHGTGAFEGGALEVEPEAAEAAQLFAA